MKLRLANQPVVYEKLAKAVVYLLVGFALVTWTDSQIVLVLALIDSVLGIIIWNSVTPNARVQEQVDTAVNAAQNETLANVASLAELPPERERPLRSR